jgi:hypothetical protein
MSIEKLKRVQGIDEEPLLSAGIHLYLKSVNRERPVQLVDFDSLTSLMFWVDPEVVTDLITLCQSSIPG